MIWSYERIKSRDVTDISIDNIRFIVVISLKEIYKS